MWDRVPASQSPHSYRGDNRGHAPNIVSGSGRTVKKQSGVKRGTEGGKDLSKELTLSRDPKEVRARQGKARQGKVRPGESFTGKGRATVKILEQKTVTGGTSQCGWVEPRRRGKRGVIIDNCRVLRKVQQGNTALLEGQNG